MKISKTITHAFLHIYLPSPHDYDVEVPNFTFCVGRERKATTFFSFSWTFIRLLELNFGKICQHLKNWARWNKRDKVWSSANSPLTFWYPLPSLLLKLPILLSEIDINNTKEAKPFRCDKRRAANNNRSLSKNLPVSHEILHTWGLTWRPDRSVKYQSITL